MPNFEDTTSDSAQGKAQVIMSHRDESSTVGKRSRRQRSYAGRAHTGSKGKKAKKPGNNHDSNVRPNIPQGHNPLSKGVALFLQKTYHILSTCDEDLAGWTNDGTFFVVKDKNRFQKEIIPRYFDAKKFSSFVRQLNFYGFRKIQGKPLRNADIDTSTAGYVAWCHENFQRDAPELLRHIKRSTKGGGNACDFEDQQQQIDQLKKQVASCEGIVAQLISKIDLTEKKFSVLTQQLSENNYHIDQSPDKKERVRQLSMTHEPKFSKPTLQDHPKIKKGLPPDSTWCVGPPISPNSNRALSSTSFIFRSLSVETNQLLDSTLGDIMYNAFTLDGTEIEKNEKEAVVNSSQNSTAKNELKRINTEEIDQIDQIDQIDNF